MENKKSKKGLLIVLIILILLVCLSIPTKTALKDGGTVIYKAPLWSYTKYHSLDVDGYYVGDQVKILGIKVIDNTKIEKYSKKAKKVSENTKTDSKSDDNSNSKNTKTNVSDSDLEKDTLVTIVDTNCTGHNRGAKIIDGNIQVYDSDGYDLTIKVGNAKYLKVQSFMACDNTYLLFMTENGQVYSIKKAHELVNESMKTGKTEYTLSDIFSSVEKLTNSQDNATAFLKDGVVSRSTDDEYGLTSYNVGILEADDSIGTITYEYIKLP
ncbi:MAG: hypothetical protein J5970_03180 [Bacilli bacterium]|nr:hypothetical protein [Bacilli bacterium]